MCTPVDNEQLQKATDNVKARYRRKGLIRSSTEQDPWPPFPVKSFVNLALVHQKAQLQTKEDTVILAKMCSEGCPGEISESTSYIKLNSIYQIFSLSTSDMQVNCSMRILIEGHPGIGKTTLAKEICLQWASDQLLTSYKLVLLLMLRDPVVQKVTNIEQMVNVYYLVI